MSGIKIYFNLTNFPCLTILQDTLWDEDILTQAAVGVSKHGRMCVGVLAILKTGHAWETSVKPNTCMCLCLCWGRRRRRELRPDRASVWHKACECETSPSSEAEIDSVTRWQECVCLCEYVGACAHTCMHWKGPGHICMNTFKCLKPHMRYAVFLSCVCLYVCVCVWMRVCLQPCLQGEVEADALAAGLARLSGPNLQRRKREREER